jgi:hypothetical protein
MTTKADYTDGEWATLRRAPMVAGMAISLADPGGPIEATKETLAALRTLRDPAAAGAESELTTAVAKDVQEASKQRQNPLGDFKPRGALAGQQILEELQRANAILTEKAAPEEAAAFRRWIVAAAQASANAAKEGGFMGFGAERVSQGEKEMLDKVAEAAGAGAPG